MSLIVKGESFNKSERKSGGREEKWGEDSYLLGGSCEGRGNKGRNKRRGRVVIFSRSNNARRRNFRGRRKGWDYSAEFDVVCSPSFCRPVRRRHCRWTLAPARILSDSARQGLAALQRMSGKSKLLDSRYLWMVI